MNSPKPDFSGYKRLIYKLPDKQEQIIILLNATVALAQLAQLIEAVYEPGGSWFDSPSGLFTH